MVISRRALAVASFLSVFYFTGIGPTTTSFQASPWLDISTVWAQGLPKTLTLVDRSRPGSQTGVLTSVRGRAMLIDKNTYRVASAILIEDRKGMPISLEELRSFNWNTGLEVMTTYWISLNEITQIIVILPE